MFRSWNSEFNEITSMQRKSRKDQILNEIHKVTTDFDSKILRLENERFHVEYKSKFLECHLLSLYQEVWIIKDCQRIERHIMNEMNAIIVEANNVNTEIEVQRARIASKKINIRDLEAEANQIDETFARECMQDQRFAIFLRKIYKTKENVKEADVEGLFFRNSAFTTFLVFFLFIFSMSQVMMMHHRAYPPVWTTHPTRMISSTNPTPVTVNCCS